MLTNHQRERRKQAPASVGIVVAVIWMLAAMALLAAIWISFGGAL